jgi:DNA modification methylase
MANMESAPSGLEYRFGDQSVYVGDSRGMGQIASKSIDFFITSPPYWNLKKYGPGREIGQGDYEQYLSDLNAVWNECYRCATDNAVLVVNINSRRVKKRFYPIPFDIVARMQGWKLWDHVIWYIPNALPQCDHYRERLLDNKHEACLVFTKDGSVDYRFHKPRVPQKYKDADPRQHKKNAAGRCIGNVVRIPAYRPPNVKELGYHVAAFPEELVAFFLECYTDVGSRVLDPFLGSGSTLKVCRVMRRTGIGFEVNESFLPLINKRLEEEWSVPDWKRLDIHHSTTMETGMTEPRKIHFHRRKSKPTLL